jgi:mannose-6-phosphate isomerase
MSFDAPLSFRPVYKNVLWGGRRLARWRADVPDGPVGESWDAADHDHGMSVVDAGPHAGTTLRALVSRLGAELVGEGFAGGPFPLLVKIIDAADRLSVQVHPDDALARALGVGDRGKTECWLFLADGGELYQGTQPGIDRAAFERALADGRVADALNRFEPRLGDVFFLPARTVHALGAGCLVYEVQQTCDVTFRVHDWDRVGADGRPRPLHLRESLDTIDFARSGFGPQRPTWRPDGGGDTRRLADCAYFRLDERRLSAGRASWATGSACALVTCLEGEGTLAAPGGERPLAPLGTVLVPAGAGRFTISAAAPLRLLVATPKPEAVTGPGG